MNRAARRKAAKLGRLVPSPRAIPEALVPLLVAPKNPPQPAPRTPAPVNHGLKLAKLRAKQRQLERELDAAARQAIADGWSYASVGRLLGITRQSAWERFRA